MMKQMYGRQKRQLSPHDGAHPGDLVLHRLGTADNPTDGLAAAVGVVVEAGGRFMQPAGRQRTAGRLLCGDL